MSRWPGLLSGGISAADLREAGAAETYPDPAGLLDKLAASAIGPLMPGAGGSD